MSSSEKEREAQETGVSPSKPADENAAEPAASENPAAEEESQDRRPVTLVHLQQNFGVMSRVLEREVFRRGLINSSVEETYSVFFQVSSLLMEMFRMEIDPRVLRAQLLDMLLAILEPTYGADHTRMLMTIIERSANDLFLFQAILSSTSLDALVQRVQEIMNPPARSSGSNMSGGVSGNYNNLPNENVRGLQLGYNNPPAAVRLPYGDFSKERRGEQLGEPNVPRNANAYTEGSNAPASSQPEDDAMPTVNSGWGNAQRKYTDHDRDVPIHHHHHHLHHHRLPFNQYVHQQRHQLPNVAQNHQVVVGSGPMGLQPPQQHQQQQQQQQQQQPELSQGGPYPRAPVSQGPFKRVGDRAPPNAPEPDDPHAHGAMWRGAVPPSGPPLEPVAVPQPSYHPQNSPPTPHSSHNPHHHQVVSPNSPSHPRMLVQHRHTINHFFPPGSMGKQMAPQPTTQMTPQTMPQPATAAPPPNSQRVVVHHHHHHHFHHHHDLSLQQPGIPRVSPPPHTNLHAVKQEAVAQPESKPVAHNVETAAPQLKPHFHHQISFQHLKVLRPPTTQMNAPTSVGGVAAEPPSHGLMIPTHHHSIHNLQQNRPVVPPQHQYRQSASSAPAPMSIDALSDEEMNWASPHAASMLPMTQELRCFFRDRSVPEAVINALVRLSLTLDELLAIPREMFEEQLKKEVVSVHSRQYVWSVLHPNEKPLSEKDGPELHELRNFIHNNSIHNNMAPDGGGEEDSAMSRRGRQTKAMLQVPQPRTSQSKQQQQQPGKGGEYKAVIWLSGVNSGNPHLVFEELSRYGKVLQHGPSSQKTDLIYCKLGDHKNELQTMRKIGGAVVEEFYRVSPRDIGDGAPPTPTGRSEEGENNGSSKARHKAGGGANPYTSPPQQQQQQSLHRGGYGEGDEEDIDGDEGRGHRKGVRHSRGRGRGGHHNYHPHRHSEGNNQVICKFFSKGICKFGDQCQYFHPTKSSSRS